MRPYRWVLTVVEGGFLKCRKCAVCGGRFPAGVQAMRGYEEVVLRGQHTQVVQVVKVVSLDDMHSEHICG